MNPYKDETRDIWSNIAGISSQVLIPTVYIFKNYVGLFLYYPPRQGDTGKVDSQCSHHWERDYIRYANLFTVSVLGQEDDYN